MILKDYDKQVSLNLFDRRSLASFHEWFAWIAMK